MIGNGSLLIKQRKIIKRFKEKNPVRSEKNSRRRV